MERIYSNADGNEVNGYVFRREHDGYHIGCNFSEPGVIESYNCNKVYYLDNTPYLPKGLDVNSLNKVGLKKEGSVVWPFSTSSPAYAQIEAILQYRDEFGEYIVYAHKKDPADAKSYINMAFDDLIGVQDVTESIRDMMISSMMGSIGSYELVSERDSDSLQWIYRPYISIIEDGMIVTRKATQEEITPIKEWYENSPSSTSMRAEIIAALNKVVYE